MRVLSKPNSIALCLVFEAPSKASDIGREARSESEITFLRLELETTTVPFDLLSREKDSVSSGVKGDEPRVLPISAQEDFKETHWTGKTGKLPIRSCAELADDKPSIADEEGRWTRRTSPSAQTILHQAQEEAVLNVMSHAALTCRRS